MHTSYARQTLDSPNPFARYAHRSRLRKSVALTLAKMVPGAGKILDYGCGSGTLVFALRNLDYDAVGYEPFMEERVAPGLPIYRSTEEVVALGPYSVITLFETIEHLHDWEIDAFLEFSQRTLCGGGGILISAPVEIGPALLLKELSRNVHPNLRWPLPHRFGHPLGELLKAALLGVAAVRAENIKISHKGFDFRRAIKRLREKGWLVRALAYGPLPIGTWYGNSQVFLWVSGPQSTTG
jgi:SAM-dependent methyltransferase